MNRPNPQLPKSEVWAYVSIFTSILALLLYKIWKVYLRQNLGLDPYDDYLKYEFFSTCFRFLNSLIGIGICFWVYEKALELYKLNFSKVFWVGFGYSLAIFPIKLICNGIPDFSLHRFLIELPINFFTGVSEEFLFRGLLFAGLIRVSNLKFSFGASSLFFALWHLDVGTNFSYMVMLFSASLVYSALFWLGVPLFSIAIFHFLWDQLVFGFLWPNGSFEILNIVTAILNLVFFYFLVRGYWQKASTQNS